MANRSIRPLTCVWGCSSTAPERPRDGGGPRETIGMRRVVVTGMGIVSSIGNNTQEVLASLREAKSGIVKADDYARLGFRCQVHGAPNLDLDRAVDRRARRFMGDGPPGIGRRCSRRSLILVLRTGR